MTDRPSNSTLKSLVSGKSGPLIVDSCYGGEAGDNGVSNAGSLADAAGVSRERAYGCTGEEGTIDASTLDCDGTWVDGNQNAIADDQRGTYGMKNCVVSKRNSSGQWIKFKCN